MQPNMDLGKYTPPVYQYSWYNEGAGWVQTPLNYIPETPTMHETEIPASYLNVYRTGTPEQQAIIRGMYGSVLLAQYGLAAGGVVTSPTIAMIGEAGPEAVVPLSKGGGGGDVVVQLVIDADVVGQAVFSKLSLLGGVKS
jgi:hypothetical protein